MSCPSAPRVEEFVFGRLEGVQLAEFEAHLDECGECFLRVATAATEASREIQATLRSRPISSSRLERFLTETHLAETLLDDEHQPSSSPDSRSRQVGPWMLTGVLGVGGMGIVYRARHAQSGREAALKTIKHQPIASAVSMLRQEIELLQGWQHPAIVSVLDSDAMADEPWYAMELFDGPTVRELNRRWWSDARFGRSLAGKRAAGGKLAEALTLFARLSDPLDFIHQTGTVHGDLKPSNVFLRDGQNPILMDFGLASRARGALGREALVVTGRPRGSLPYIAPEIIRGQIPDTRADLYALGCMLYETLTGHPPFLALSGTKIVDMHLHAAPEPPSRLVADIPPDLEVLVLRLLAKDPQDRFGHASALRSSLESIAGRLSRSHRAPISSSQPITLFRSPMVGRDSELSVVLPLVERAQNSARGAFILVSGESGIGKTFFTTEVAQRASLIGMQVVTGECVPLAQSTDAVADAGTTPLHALRGFFEMLREHCNERGPTEVVRLFGDRLPLLSHYVPLLARLVSPRAPHHPPPQLPASATRERIVSAVVDIIVSYAETRPLLLALDDLQWGDDLTLAVLERLDESILAKLPLVVIANYRSDEAQAIERRLAGRSQNHELRLGRLKSFDIRALLGGMLSMSRPPEALIDYVDAHAEGIPFFAAEYLRSLVAAGALVYEVGTWSTNARNLDEFRAERAGEVPRTLQELIRGRLGRLAPDVVVLLEAGAVLGRRFAIASLQRMLEREGQDLASVLSAACAMQVIQSEDDDTYTFLHDKIRETLYKSLPEARRAQLHRSAARALERGDATRPDDYGPLAHHFRQAGEVQRALDFLEKAGSHGLSLAAYADADRFLADALQLEASATPRQPNLRRARWLRQRGDALGGLGRMNESATALKASAGLLGRPFPESKGGFAVSLAREVTTQVRHRLLPSRARPLTFEQNEVNKEVMHVFERMHEVSYYLGRDADLVLSTTVSLNSSERGGATPSLAIAYSNAAMMAGVLPIPSLAQHYFRLANATIDATPDVSAESWLLEMEGHYLGWQGQREQAVASLERAIVLARQGGFFRRSDEAECVRIGLDLVAGLHEEVVKRTQGVERSARKRHDLQVQSWTSLQRAEAHLIAGDYDSARSELTHTSALLPTLGKPERIWATGLDAFHHLRTGQSQTAHDLLKTGVGLIVGGPPVHSYCIGACDRLAQTAIELCQAESSMPAKRRVAALAHKACSVLEKAARVFPNARPAALLHRGSLNLLRRSKVSEALLKSWQRGVAISEQLGLPYHELRLRSVLLRQATTHDDVGTKRTRELRSQLRIAETTPL
jgi:eukaryotic-like serine/threonine-protein kinase